MDTTGPRQLKKTADVVVGVVVVVFVVIVVVVTVVPFIAVVMITWARHMTHFEIINKQTKMHVTLFNSMFSISAATQV